MFILDIPTQEAFDESTQKFVRIHPVTIELEHSLVSLSKWESKYEKSFISTPDKSPEEVLDYIRMMTLTPGIDDSVFYALTQDLVKQITDYIGSQQTATTISQRNKKPNREIITSEIIYHWMIDLNIDFQCQYWHLNRLITLIQVCSEKNAPQKRMSRKELMERNRSLNAARRARTGSSG